MGPTVTSWDVLGLVHLLRLLWLLLPVCLAGLAALALESLLADLGDCKYDIFIGKQHISGHYTHHENT